MPLNLCTKVGEKSCYSGIKAMSLKDLLYPKFCVGCGFIGAYICPKCFKKITPIIRGVCLWCGKVSGDSLTHLGCLQRLNIVATVSIFEYNPFMKKIVKNVKYRLARGILDELLNNITPEHLEGLLKFKKVFSGALIQPIPLSASKLNTRGFNQALILAKFFSSVLGLKTADYLTRKNNVTPQAELKSRRERYKNIRGVFGLRPGVRIRDKKIIIVDDVVTTGATVYEASRILKSHGAGEIYALSLAR